MTGIDPQAPVLVTGASGYMGSWIVRRLLEEGHTVRGSVRDPDKKSGLEHLHKIKGLTWIDVRNTKTTQEGQDALKKALPNAHVVSDLKKK